MASSHPATNNGEPCGYSESIFENRKKDPKYLCSSCELPLKEPYQNACGHRFCKKSITFLATKTRVKCPQCIKENFDDPESQIYMETIFPDNAVKREMQSFKVRCPNPGCTWKGLLREYDTHEASCSFKPRMCPCGARIVMSEYEQHQRRDCPARLISCLYCNSRIAFSEMDPHTVKCKETEVQCQYCDKIGIKRKNLSVHRDPVRNDCRKKRDVCPFGCQVLIPMADMNHHKQSKIREHVDYLLKSQQELDKRVQSHLPASDSSDCQSTNTNIATRDVLPIERNDDRENQDPSTRNDTHLPDNASASTTIEESSQQNPLAGVLEGIIMVQNKEIEKALITLGSTEDQLRQCKQDVTSLRNLVQQLERTLSIKDVQIVELQQKMEAQATTSYNGVLIWKIDEIAKRRQEAVSGRVTSFYSPCFFTSRTGYKMCARIYLNGDGMGRGSHVSLFFVIMRGMYDALLKWPFRQKVTLSLLDQGTHAADVVDAFRPDPTSSSFKRPTSDMNIASGCPLFMPLSQLDMTQYSYVKDDTLFVKIGIDCSDLI